MTAPSLAWSAVNLYKLPSGRHIVGRQFELLPAGTMFAASSILNGIIGVEAEPLDHQRCRVEDDAMVLIYGIGGTQDRELDSYRNDMIEGYRLRQLQDAQS